MINIFENSHGIPRVHKRFNKYGDYILSVRKNFESIKRINLSINEVYLPYCKLLESLYKMPGWDGTPQGSLFWNFYLKHIEAMDMDFFENIWENDKYI